MSLEILLTALCAVALLFTWSEWRLRKMPQTEKEFQQHRTVEYLLLAGVFMIASAALVFALQSGIFAIMTAAYLSGCLLFLGCVFLVVVAVRVIREVVQNKKAVAS